MKKEEEEQLEQYCYLSTKLIMAATAKVKAAREQPNYNVLEIEEDLQRLGFLTTVMENTIVSESFEGYS